VTARDDLLGAANSLADRGQVEFSVSELIAEARLLGCKYPDTTLRTHVADTMRADKGRTRGRPGFVNVRRGVYRLGSGEEGTDMRPPRPNQVVVAVEPSSPVKVAHDAEWFWEGNVQSAVVRILAADGWDIIRVAATASREHGIDVEAKKGGQRLLVEVKGYPGATYSRGPNAGEPKPHGVGAQARTYFGNGLLAGLTMRGDHPDARIVVAFPSMETFRNLSRRVIVPLRDAGVEIWLVDDNGVATAVDRGSSR
jgi:hypothetical protein